MGISHPILKPSISSPPHCLYFFLGTVDYEFLRKEWMFVKVGVANNVHRRLKSYQTHCPIPFQTGLKVVLPSEPCAKKLESAILNDELLKGYSSQGEWFVVFGGPQQHVSFFTNLLARFYIERYRDKSLWNSRLEWVIIPNQERAVEIPGADTDFFCGVESGEKSAYAVGTDQEDIAIELNFRVKAQKQAEALGSLIYAELATD